MATYRMTPSERRARALERKQQSENRILYKQYLQQVEEYNKRKEEYEKQVEEECLNAIYEEREKNSQNFFVRGLHTIGDIAANVITGAVKGLEGIYDLGAGLVGAVGGIFDDGFQDRVKEHIAYDWTMETFGNDWQEALKYSYTDNGGIVEGVASGIGQMLPAVAVTIATGGAGAPAAVAQAASLGTMAASAGGNATEQAFKEGAGYYQGLGYGVLSGAVEAGTEKLFGGATKGIFGKGMLDGVGKSVAATGVKRVAKNMVEEGVEEVVAELVNPALKSIYKGGEAFSEYGKGEYWKGVGKAGAIGSLTALAYSGSVGYGLSKIGKGYVGSEADINESLMEIDTQKKKAENLFANDKLTEKNDEQISSNVRENYKNIERTLTKAKDKKRASLIEKFSLGSAFETDGTMKVDFATKLGLVATDTQVDTQGQENSTRPLASLFNKEYYSPSLRGNEDIIQTDLTSITEKLRADEQEFAREEGREVREIAEVTPFNGTMTEQGRKNFAQTKKAINYLNGKSGGNVRLVVVNPHESFNGNIVNDSTIYIGADTFENGTWAETIVHEYTHFAEGTKEYVKLVKFLQTDIELLDKAFTSFVNRGYANAELIKNINEKQARGEALTEQETLYMENLFKSRTFQSEMGAIMSEGLLGNEQFIDKIIHEDSSIAEKVMRKIKDLKAMFERMGKPEARAEYKQLAKAEKLYLKAIEKAGYKYHNGKILVRRKKEEIDSTSQNEYNSDEIQSSRKRTATYINKSLDEFTLRDINNKLYKLYEGVDDCIADGIAIENGETLYVVDSGKDNEKISFGVREAITITDAKLRQESLEEINVRAIQDRFVSEELFEKLGYTPGQHSTSNIGREVSSELSTNTKQASNNQGRVFEGNENRRVQIKSSLKPIQETNLKRRGVNGDALLDCIDLAEEILSVGGEITPTAKAVLYHATTKENASKIRATGEMYGKEPNLYFSTKKDGVIKGYGDSVVRVEIPLEKLKMNDLFDDEAHLTMEVKPYKMTSIRFSLKVGNETLQVDGEETKNLVAVHNLTNEQLLKIIDLGGFPMPSIAVIKDETGHEEYGETSIIFGRETIDPQASRYNKIYGGDAWTPVYPTIEYKVRESIEKKISDKYYKIAKEFGYEEARPLYNYVHDLERQLNKARGKNNTRGEVALLEEIYEDRDIMQLCLLDKGKEKVKSVYRQTKTELPKVEVEKYDFLIKELGEGVIREVMTPSGENIFNYRTKYLEKYRTLIDDALTKYYKSLGVKESDIENLLINQSKAETIKTIRGALNYLENGTTTIKEEFDSQATNKAIDEALPEEEYKKWVDDLFKGIEEKSGIRNEKDYYTPNGDARSFDALHYENTLENVIRVMRAEIQKGGGTLFGGQAIWGVATKDFGTIEELKKDSYRLERRPKEEYEKTREELTERLEEIAKSIRDTREDNYFISLDNAATNIIDTVRTQKTKPAMLKYLKSYNPAATMKTIDDIVQLVQDIANMPTEYFEAKPQRAVGLDEIKMVLLPQDTKKSILDILNKNDIPYQTYDSTQEGARGELVKNLDESVKFSRKEDKRYYYQLSKGQIKKLFANNTHYKVYSKVDAEKIINNILSNYMSFGDKYGEINGKTKAEVIDMLWQGLNSAQPGYQTGVALNVADYIIQNSVLESMYSDMYDAEVQHAMDIIEALKPYLHSINLDSLKGEISYRYDTDKSPYLLWGKRKGDSGKGADQIAMELEESGIFIDAINEAEIFFEIDSQYRNAVKSLKKKAKEILAETLTKEELHQLKQDIAKEVLRGFDYTGDSSKLAKVVDIYKKRIAKLNEALKDEKAHNRVVNRVLDKIQKIKDIKLGTFLNAFQYKSELFKGSIEKLSNIKYRGNLNESGTREILEGLLGWYTKENPILNYVNEENKGLFDEEIHSMLEALASGKGTLKTEELLALENVVNYFIHFVENFNKVYRNGKYVEAQPIVEKYLGVINANKGVKVGWLTRFFDKVFNNSKGSYLQTFADPMTVARKMDMYEEGFYTEMLEELRKGSIAASVMEMNIRESLDEFLDKHKKFLNELAKRTITYKGETIPMADAFLLYMTLNREQAIRGLAYAGFTFEDSKGKTHRVEGFTTDEELTFDELVELAKAEQEELYKQFTEVDKEYISIAEKIFNEDCKEAKRKTDILRKGYSNILEGYYVPIRRAYIASNVDQSTFADEMNRVSNASFNKDTVRGAKNELFIEGLDSVLDRHIKAISQYANLSTVIDQYNILYNLNTSENPNKPISVKTEGVNIWDKGDAYFKKLISDIQGISPVKGGINKIYGAIRGGYAKYQLGANPKTWATQLSSLFASSSILDYSSIVKGIGIETKDIFEYCDLAKLRGYDNSAVNAQAVSTNKIGQAKNQLDNFTDLLMKPIGMVDGFVVRKLFGACQVQVEKNNGLKVGTIENKKKAGELLTRVILETQQNSLATEKSAAMRSGSELMKTLTMFTSDSMKVFGRVIDSVGEVSTLKAKIRQTTDPEVKKSLEEKLKKANAKARKSITALVSSAIFMALIAQAFRWLYNKDDEDDNVAVNMTVDAIGNLFGGLPLIKDVYSKLVEGYDINDYTYSTLNGILDAFAAILNDEGKTPQQIKNLVNAVGQLMGVPTRNVYNFVYGITKRISPSTAYEIDNAFYNKNYSADLSKAIENDDEKMIATIVGIMLDERVGDIKESSTRQELNDLVGKGFDVLPRSIGGTITYEGEKITLTNKQKEQFKKVYSEANETLASLVEGKFYQSASEEVRAKAIKFVYEIYYNLALEDLLGLDLETKNILFAKAVDIPSLAIIVATARSFESDKDEKGKTIAGTKKAKVQQYVNSLGLKATQKYMIMGYLGYTNKYGASQVKRYIQSLSLTKTQKELLYEYSGYSN